MGPTDSDVSEILSGNNKQKIVMNKVGLVWTRFNPEMRKTFSLHFWLNYIFVYTLGKKYVNGSLR